MNHILKTSLIVVVVLVIAGGLFFAGSLFSRFTSQRMGFDGQGMGRNGNMPMQQNGPDNQGNQPDGRGGGMGQRQPGNLPGQGGGRMGGQQGQNSGPGMRGGMDGMGPGDMGPNGNQANLTPVTSEEATKAAQDYIASLKIAGLEVGEVLLVSPHAYVTVKETATGNGAFELMVDPRNKQAHPAMGPATMWNLKYGGVLQTSMVGRKGQQNLTVTATPAPVATPADVSADMPLSAADAIKAAQTFLDTNYAGATAASTALKFYGYYSIDFSKDGKVVGRLSVNGFNGQVAGNGNRP